ncbi:hypothetical protein [Acidobacterium sp. S8]|uniref:hypothetical protein n=1 Tax=Acidobacterium sp. S8 TaxID=1641854 RepID=UPI0020B1664B|nr:hypothetical protein [Acidobacterium sp. S8]
MALIVGCSDKGKRSGAIAIAPACRRREVYGWVIAELNLNEGYFPFDIASNVRCAEKALQVEELVYPVELHPAAVIAWAEGVVLVVADGLCAGGFDFLDSFGREDERLVEPDDVWSVLVYSFEQVAVRGGNQWTDG